MGAMQRLREKFNLPFNPIWLIIALVIIVFIIATYFLIFYVPKACRPLADTIEGAEYRYGCNDETCFIWPQGMSGISSFSMHYLWENGDSGSAACEINSEDPETLSCTFPAISSEGGVSIMVGDDVCESTPYTFLENDEIAEVKEQSRLQREAACSAFSDDLNNALQKTELSYEYDPLSFNFQIGGMEEYENLDIRYVWGNGVTGDDGYCWLAPDNIQFCSLPSEYSITDLDVWALSGECEQHLHTFDASDVNWSDYDTCKPEFTEAMRAIDTKFDYSCTEELQACGVWVSGLSEFDDPTIAYKLNGSQDLEFMSNCDWDVESNPEIQQLFCYFELEGIPDRVAVYVDLDSCPIYLGALHKKDIEDVMAYNQTLE